MDRLTGFAQSASLLVVLLFAAEASAEVYTWIDKRGIMHFTNVPDDPRAKPIRVEDTHNTFSWSDGLGAMRRLHRVDITRYDEAIREAAAYYELPPAFIKAIIAAESAFEPSVVSSAGAQGLMQLMPQTAKAMLVNDPFDPRANIYGGTRYLRFMANQFEGDIRLTAAAYNAGPDAVANHEGVPPYEETRTYVKRVLKLYRYYLKNWH